MNLKKINRIFGYGLFGIGAIKIIYTIFLLSKISNNVNSAFNGGEWNYGFFSLIITVINLVQVLLMIVSAIMIFVNIKEQPKVIKGYAWGLGSMLVTYIIPSWPWLIIGTLILQCGMLMKAGTEIMSTSDTYKNEFWRSRLTLLQGMYDSVLPEYKEEALKIIFDRLNNDAYAYLNSPECSLSKRVKSFYGMLKHKKSDVLYYKTLMLARYLYRKLKHCI